MNNESDRLSNDRLKLLRDPNSLEIHVKNIENRNAYINQTKINSEIRSAIETTFTDNNDDKTVTIKRGVDLSTIVLAPKVFLPAELLEEPENENIFSVENFIRRNYDGNFKLDLIHNDKAIELIRNTNKTNNNITFKPLIRKNVHGKPQIVLKRNSKGELEYNNAKTAKEAVKQFKKLIDKIQKEQEDRDEIVEYISMVDTTVKYKPIKG